MADRAEQTHGPLFADVPDAARRAVKSAGAFRTISEVATDLDVPQHVLRFWETKFSQIRPLKRGGGRRYYRPEDVELLRDGGLKAGRAAAEQAHGAAPRIVEAAPAQTGHGATHGAAKPAPSIAQTTKAIGASGLDADTKLALKALLEELSGLRALLKR